MLLVGRVVSLPGEEVDRLTSLLLPHVEIVWTSSADSAGVLMRETPDMWTVSCRPSSEQLLLTVHTQVVPLT